MALSDESLINSLKFLGALVLSTLVALFGTAAVGSPISRALRPHTIAGVLEREWILSIVVAGVLGFFVWRSWKFAASRWVWVLPTVWFGLRFILALTEPSYHSVFVHKNLWTRFSGLECAEGPRAPGCVDWFLFTLRLFVEQHSRSEHGLPRRPIVARLCRVRFLQFNLSDCRCGIGLRDGLRQRGRCPFYLLTPGSRPGLTKVTSLRDSNRVALRASFVLP